MVAPSQLVAAQGTAQHMGEASAANTLVASSQLVTAQGTAQRTGGASGVSTFVAPSRLVAAQGIALRTQRSKGIGAHISYALSHVLYMNGSDAIKTCWHLLQTAPGSNVSII